MPKCASPRSRRAKRSRRCRSVTSADACVVRVVQDFQLPRLADAELSLLRQGRMGVARQSGDSAGHFGLGSFYPRGVETRGAGCLISRPRKPGGVVEGQQIERPQWVLASSRTFAAAIDARKHCNTLNHCRSGYCELRAVCRRRLSRRPCGDPDAG